MHENSRLKTDPHYNPYNRNGRSFLGLWVLLCAMTTMPTNSLFAQNESPGVSPRIAGLADNDLAVRNAAERQITRYLMESEQTISEWLATQENSPLLQTAEVQHRLERIRFSIAEARQFAVLSASSIGPNIDIANPDQLVARLSTTVGVPIQLHPSTKQSASLNLPEFNEVPEFWQLVDQFCRINSLSISSADGGFVLSNEEKISSGNQPYIHSSSNGPVWAALLPSAKADSFEQLRLQMFWEPKLKVLNAQFPMIELKIEKADGLPWGLFNREATLSVPIREQALGTRFRLPVSPIRSENGREGNVIPAPAAVQLPYRLVVLAEPAKPRFENVLDLDKPLMPFRSGMATISIRQRALRDGVLRIQVFTQYEPAEMAQRIQSHDTWSQFCSATLVSKTGATLEPAKQQQVQQNSYQHLMEYEFELPDKNRQNLLGQQWALEFETPSGMMALEDTITLRQGN